MLNNYKANVTMSPCLPLTLSEKYLKKYNVEKLKEPSHKIGHITHDCYTTNILSTAR